MKKTSIVNIELTAESQKIVDMIREETGLPERKILSLALNWWVEHGRNKKPEAKKARTVKSPRFLFKDLNDV